MISLFLKQKKRESIEQNNKQQTTNKKKNKKQKRGHFRWFNEDIQQNNLLTKTEVLKHNKKEFKWKTTEIITGDTIGLIFWENNNDITIYYNFKKEMTINKDYIPNTMPYYAPDFNAPIYGIVNVYGTVASVQIIQDWYKHF